jgi:hypothetical protein
MFYSTVDIVYPSHKSTNVDIVKLFVALPTNQSKYILLPAKNEKNITWHGRAFRFLFQCFFLFFKN